MNGNVSTSQGAAAAADQLAYHVIGRNPKTWAVIIMAMTVVLILFMMLFVYYYEKYNDCHNKGTFLGSSPLGNLNTGSNNPMWQGQMGDAGWGGSMHSTYQPGQARVWGSSAEGGHAMAVVPQLVRSCANAGLGSGVSPAAAGEAAVLTAAQAIDMGSSASHMDDDALVRVMYGGA